MIKILYAKWFNLALFFGLALLSSCTQDEGFGGNGKIKGQLIEKTFDNDFKVLLSEEPAKAEDIFIVFGNATTVGDKVETSFTGDFEFTYLWPGTYTIYYMSEDTSDGSMPEMEVLTEINLGKNETIDMGTLYRYNSKDWDDGSSKIKGVLIERIYNDDLSILLDEVPAKAEDVYVQLGSSAFNDNVETTYAGAFEFSGLWQGDYTLYYLSEDTADNSQPDVEMAYSVSINNDEVINLDTLYTYSIKEWDEGSSVIRGKVMVTNYRNSSSYPNLVVKDITPAQEQEVYITYGNHGFYDERIRTQDDGTFEFKNLIKGSYRIFVYSEDVVGGTAYKVVETTVNVTEKGEIINLDTFEIEKL